MKNKLKFFLLLALLFSLQSKAQLDTLNYLKQFEINKANYIGYPFSKLLNNMTQIQPMAVWNTPPRNNKNIGTKTGFSFCKMQNSFHNTITLMIVWQQPIPNTQTHYYEQLNDFYFTNDEKLFFGNKIVKDIMVYR
ncbi:hypothetical protein [Chryseobacterium gambrini]|uniref:Uncharacterized protein n=1 Tax=Chryseobacterium gambrini TaxID=373672 RepID=A0ABM8KCA2_9FLAO|nr:hypothetical protein CRDW_40640 [Chryseobacterium gambrini]